MGVALLLRSLNPPPSNVATARLARTASPLVRKVGLTTIALGVSGATTLVFNVVLAQTLSQHAYGDTARTLALAMAIAQITMASFAPAIARRVARGKGQEERERRAVSGFRILGVLSVIAAVAYGPLAVLGFAPSSALDIVIGTLIAAIYSSYFGLKVILFSLDWVTRYAKLEIACDVLFFLTLAGLVLVAPSAAGMTFVVAYAVFLIVGARWLRGIAPSRIRIDASLVRFSALAFVGTYSVTAQFPLCIALVGALQDSAESARLAAVLAVVMPFYLVPQAAGMITFAEVARSGEGEDPSAAVRGAVRLVGAISALAALAAVVVGGPVIAVLLGPDFRDMAPTFTLIVCALVPQLAATPIGHALVAGGGVAVKSALAFVGLVLSIVATLIFVPSHGAPGAGIGLAAATLFMGVVSLGFGRRYYALQFRDVAPFLSILAIAGIAYATIYSP